jgi:hypothetical protein
MFKLRVPWALRLFAGIMKNITARIAKYSFITSSFKIKSYKNE